MRLRLFVLLLVAMPLLAAERFAYVFQRGGNDSIMRVQGSIEHFQRIARRWKGEFIWARIGGRDYLVRDAAVLASANAAFAPMDELEPQVRAAAERLRPIEEKYDAVSDRDDDDPSLPELERRLEAAEREVDRLENEMERRETIAEKKFEEIVLRAIRTGKALRVD